MTTITSCSSAPAGDLAVTAGWGHAGQGGITMPGKGKANTRPWTSEELAAIGQGAEALGLSAEEALAQLGDQAVDVYLNGVAYWRGVTRMARRIAASLLLEPELDANCLAVKGGMMALETGELKTSWRWVMDSCKLHGRCSH